MRPVDAVVIFKQTGDCLLLSELEADRILQLMWQTKNADSTVQMCPLTYLIKSAVRGWDYAPELLVPIQNGKMEFKIKDETIAALNLFAGGTMFATTLSEKALQ